MGALALKVYRLNYLNRKLVVNSINHIFYENIQHIRKSFLQPLLLTFFHSCFISRWNKFRVYVEDKSLKPGSHFKDVSSEYFTQNPFNTLGPRAFFTMRPLYMQRLRAPWDQGCGWWKSHRRKFAISTRRILGDYRGASFHCFW